jgi:hypothetical protein
MNEVRTMLRAVYDYTAFYGSMLIFGLLCLSWSLLTLPLFALLPRRIARAWGRYGIMAAVIAKHAGVPVQTLIIDTDSPLLRKGRRFGMRPSLPITYRVRLGRRFDPPPDGDGFMAELERYYHSELRTSVHQ